MCLVNEMRVQIFKLVMRSKGTFQKFIQRKFLPSNIRSQLRVEYGKSRNQLNKETMAQLASHFHDVTFQPVLRPHEYYLQLHSSHHIKGMDNISRVQSFNRRQSNLTQVGDCKSFLDAHRRLESIFFTLKTSLSHVQIPSRILWTSSVFLRISPSQPFSTKNH